MSDLKFMTRAYLLLVLTAVVGCAGPPRPAHDPDLPTVSAQAIREHVAYLADDRLRGREAGTPGYDEAARYVAQQFELLGLAPAGDNATFFQAVPLRSSTLVQGSVELTVTGSGFERALRHNEEFIVAPSLAGEIQNISAPIVFAGFGIVAPFFEHDDYAGLDVEGKIVAVLAGRYPESFPPDEGAHYGSTDNKIATAGEHGAIGLILLRDAVRDDVYPFEDLLKDLAPGYRAMTWLHPDGHPELAAPKIGNRTVLNSAHSEVLFEGAGRTFAEIREESAETNQSPAGFPLGVTATLRSKSRQSEATSSNVVALLRGSDPVLRDEYVVLTAHLDHVGVGPERDGDSIYNGALDNATGVATMIEAARAFVDDGRPPRRSILFMALTAEEKGLIGADYFAHHPTVPIDAIVANVNLDMPIITFDFTDVVAYGSIHSSLDDPVREAAGILGLQLADNPVPEEAYFVRTDHYCFVRKGVPSVYLDLGYANGGEAASRDFVEQHYHQPSDEIDLPLNYEAGARFALLNYLVARQIADGDERPFWKPGDFFGETFGKSRNN